MVIKKKKKQEKIQNIILFVIICLYIQIRQVTKLIL